MEFNYPFQIDKNGSSQPVASINLHIRQLVEQVLFTAPGERVNRPTFGSGLNQLVFAPLSDEIVSTTQILIQAALQQWLGDIITVNSVQVTSLESVLRVQVQYIIKVTQQPQVEQFSRMV